MHPLGGMFDLREMLDSVLMLVTGEPAVVQMSETLHQLAVMCDYTPLTSEKLSL